MNSRDQLYSLAVRWLSEEKVSIFMLTVGLPLYLLDLCWYSVGQVADDKYKLYCN